MATTGINCFRWAPLKAGLEEKILVSAVYLGGDPREHGEGMEE